MAPLHSSLGNKSETPSQKKKKKERKHSFHLYKKGNGKTSSGRSFRRHPEGVVIIGDDSSMHVIAPEALPVGQVVEVEDSEKDGSDPL